MVGSNRRNHRGDCNRLAGFRARGLATESAGQIIISPLAMRRATSDVQRRLAAHLAGYMLTENSFIVRRAGDPPGLPNILNTRIAVEQIANYFKTGWGVTEIERDLPVLTREEIKAAIQYYLNNRAEIERGLRRSRDLYDANAPASSIVLNETDKLVAQGWDDHGLFKDDPDALKLFGDIEQDRDRHLIGSE